MRLYMTLYNVVYKFCSSIRKYGSTFYIGIWSFCPILALWENKISVFTFSLIIHII